MRFRLLAPLVVMAGALPLSAARHGDTNRIGSRDINRGVYGFPNFLGLEEERRIGAEIETRMRRSLTISTDSAAISKVRDLSEQILKNSDYKGDLTLHVTADGSLQACAVMGGYLFIDETVLKLASRTDELAAVIAHEIAHMAARHGAELFCYQQLVARGHRRSSAVLPSLASKIQEDELEADELAGQYLKRTGFDPSALADILCKLDQSGRTRWRAQAIVRANGQPLHR
ncbi:MAG: M48 family metalloprotease [Acidobacteria bacterium]|nr:M48 family metalloprotease [Acidobacteriota bacterium]